MDKSQGYLAKPLSTSLPFLPRLHLIILISPQHVSKGTGLSWNLAHSVGWGNRLRPDWQPHYLILFPHSHACVLLLLECVFFHFCLSSAVRCPPTLCVLYCVAHAALHSSVLCATHSCEHAHFSFLLVSVPLTLETAELLPSLTQLWFKGPKTHSSTPYILQCSM